MKATLAIVLFGLAAIAAAKTVPTVHHEAHHEENANVEHHEDVIKRYATATKDDEIRHQKYYGEKDHGYDTDYKYGKHVVGGEYYPNRPYEMEHYRPYTNAERWVDYRQQYSPYDFSSKAHSKFDKLYEQKHGYQHQYVDQKTKKTTDVEDSTVDSDYKKHDTAVHKRSNLYDTTSYPRNLYNSDYTVLGLPSQLGDQYESGSKGYPYHGGNYRQGLGYYGNHQGRDYPSYYEQSYNTPYHRDVESLNDEIDYKIKQLKHTIHKLEEIKRYNKKYVKREDVPEERDEEHVSEHHVPEHVSEHTSSYHHETPRFGFHY